MSRLQKLAQINKLANECLKDGDFVLASRFHNEFMKIAQVQQDPQDQVPGGDAGKILRSRVAKGMGLDAGALDPDIFSNVIRICDYIRPERLRNPSKPASPNNVMLRSMGGATAENSYADEYWQRCTDSFSMVNSETMMTNFKNKCDFIRKAARSGNMNAVLSQFASA
jgi:hypothetical protein